MSSIMANMYSRNYFYQANVCYNNREFSGFKVGYGRASLESYGTHHALSRLDHDDQFQEELAMGHFLSLITALR